MDKTYGAAYGHPYDPSLRTGNPPSSGVFDISSSLSHASSAEDSSAYSRNILGLLLFYEDRIDQLEETAKVCGPFYRWQAQAHRQILENAQQLRETCPEEELAPVRYHLWQAAYRLLRRQAAVFQDHKAYWEGWHPEEGEEPPWLGDR